MASGVEKLIETIRAGVVGRDRCLGGPSGHRLPGIDGAESGRFKAATPSGPPAVAMSADLEQLRGLPLPGDAPPWA